MKLVRTSGGDVFITKEPYPCYQVGDTGRGRWVQNVPVGPKLLETLGSAGPGVPTPEIEVRLIRTKARGTIMIVEPNAESVQDGRFLVHLDIGGGYRGSAVWEICSGNDNRGNSVWEALPMPEEGTGYVEFNRDGVVDVTVIAAGWRAEGIAGRAGGPHMEYLVLCRPMAIFRVTKKGRLYGAPAVEIITVTRQGVRRETESAVAAQAGVEAVERGEIEEL